MLAGPNGREGASPPSEGHLPCKFKQANHPSMKTYFSMHFNANNYSKLRYYTHSRQLNIRKLSMSSRNYSASVAAAGGGTQPRTSLSPAKSSETRKENLIVFG